MGNEIWEVGSTGGRGLHYEGGGHGVPPLLIICRAHHVDGRGRALLLVPVEIVSIAPASALSASAHPPVAESRQSAAPTLCAMPAIANVCRPESDAPEFSARR